MVRVCLEPEFSIHICTNLPRTCSYFAVAIATRNQNLHRCLVGKFDRLPKEPFNGPLKETLNPKHCSFGSFLHLGLQGFLVAALLFALPIFALEVPGLGFRV